MTKRRLLHTCSLRKQSSRHLLQQRLRFTEQGRAGIIADWRIVGRCARRGAVREPNQARIVQRVREDICDVELRSTHQLIHLCTVA